MPKSSVTGEGAKFAVVGAISTILDITFLNLAHFLGASVPWATFIGYLVGTINGYYLNNRWTYQHLGGQFKWAALSKYALISAVGLGLTELIVNYLHFLSWNLNAAKIVAVVLVFFWNFMANRFWTFRNPD